MRKRQTNPVILIATILALAIGAWWTNADAPKSGTRSTPSASPRESTPPPASAPEAAAPRSESRLEAAVPDRVEREELVRTLARIESGGPFPHKQDGTIFGNRERRLPQHPRGYYREYTVRTPGASNRGARRVVRGSEGELYYTRDHYETFIRID